MENIILPKIINETATQLTQDPDLVTYYILENARIVYLDSDIDSSTMVIQRLIVRWNLEDKDIEKEKRKPIRIYINSPGGLMYYMWPLIDTIEASVTPVHTVNMYMAASAAALIFLSGHRRFMMKNAKLIIHEGQNEISGDAVKVLDAAESYNKELKRMKDFIATHTKIPRALISKKRNNDWELDDKFCMEHGVCEKIVENLDDIF